jgi:hypothetical protein
MRSIHKQLREVGELLGMSGCGDNGCYFKRPAGAGTNGGCTCDLVMATVAAMTPETVDHLISELEP